MSGDCVMLNSEETKTVLMSRHKGWVQEFIITKGLKLHRGGMLKLNPDKFESVVTRMALYKLKKKHREFKNFTLIEKRMKWADREIYLYRAK